MPTIELGTAVVICHARDGSFWERDRRVWQKTFSVGCLFSSSAAVTNYIGSVHKLQLSKIHGLLDITPVTITTK